MSASGERAVTSRVRRTGWFLTAEVVGLTLFATLATALPFPRPPSWLFWTVWVLVGLMWVLWLIWVLATGLLILVIKLQVRRALRDYEGR